MDTFRDLYNHLSVKILDKDMYPSLLDTTITEIAEQNGLSDHV